MNANSKAAWRDLIRTGKLKGRKLDVAQRVRILPGLTAGEYSAAIHGAWKRLSELENMGVVTRGESRTCTITGYVAATWYPKEEEKLNRD